jgi:hypothetical protein
VNREGIPEPSPALSTTIPTAPLNTSKRLRPLVARCFGFVRDRSVPYSAFSIGYFIRHSLTADAITVSGDGTPVSTYLDQRYLAHLLLTPAGARLRWSGLQRGLQ